MKIEIIEVENLFKKFIEHIDKKRKQQYHTSKYIYEKIKKKNNNGNKPIFF